MRLAEPGAAGVELPPGHRSLAVEQLHDGLAVDRQVDSLAHTHIAPGRAGVGAEVVGPDVGGDIAHHLEAPLPELVQRIGRRGFDDVDLAVDEGIGAGQGVGDGHQHDAVGMGQAGLVPVAWVAHQLGAFTRHQLVEPERAGARGLAGHLVPVAAQLVPLRGAADQEPGQLVREQGIHILGGDFDRVVARLAPAGHRRDARAHLGGLLGIVLRRLVAEHLVEVPDHGVGIELGAIMELDAAAQGEGPFAWVLGIDLPFGGQARDQLAWSAADVGLPGYQWVIQGVAGELVGPGASVRLAGGQGNVGHRHAVTHHGFSPSAETRAAHAQGHGGVQGQTAPARPDVAAANRGCGWHGRHSSKGGNAGVQHAPCQTLTASSCI